MNGASRSSATGCCTCGRVGLKAREPGSGQRGAPPQPRLAGRWKSGGAVARRVVAVAGTERRARPFHVWPVGAAASQLAALRLVGAPAGRGVVGILFAGGCT